MGWSVGWRRRLPGGFLVGWRKRIGGSRRRAAGVGCGSLLLLACCAVFCLAVLVPRRVEVTLTPTGESATARPELQATEAEITLTPTERPPTDRPPTETDLPTPTATHTRPPAPTQTRPPAPTFTPAPPTHTAAPAFTVLEFTSPVPVNGDARVVVQTVPGATCSLSYRTPSGSQSGAAGLGQTSADANGICAWRWTIGASTTPGTGRVTITVNGATQNFEIVIQ